MMSKISKFVTNIKNTILSFMKKYDLKKTYPYLYNPAPTPHIIFVPPIKFFMVDGTGNPNKSPYFDSAIQCLYKISYTLKIKIIKRDIPDIDYIVPPLEGLWYMDDMRKWSVDNKDAWKWTMMIPIPEFISQTQIKQSQAIFSKTNLANIGKLRIENYKEGICVQVLYRGSYEEEGPTIKKMHTYAKQYGYKLRGKHHEIYLSDPRKTAPEKLKTILRQPILETS